MQAACRDLPVRAFQVPDGVVFARVDPETGLLAGADPPKAILESLKPGTAPTATTQTAPVFRQEDFLKQDASKS